ncbi:LPS export ABC transporter permease LptG [Roseomonas sp. CCTCC AB2023176]|uniref:LPS export ABC transporter permease LptG n=1 Tax=Roseomonas sp. CCTCC AB2023176 TaxID=3342640 RepID=UPI0035E28C0B
MRLPLTFGAYVSRRFLWMALMMLAALTGLVALFDFIELLRRAATRQDASFAVVSTIAGLRVPFIALQVLPFSILLGGILAFWRMARASELVVARSAGISAWGFLIARPVLIGPVIVASLLGVAATTGVSPLSSVMLSRAERLDSLYLRNTGGVSTLAGGRLWLRQGDRGLDPNGVAILAGRPVSERAPLPAAASAFRLEDVSFWRLGADDRFLQRIEAPRAALSDGAWVLEDATVYGTDRQPRPAGTVRFPTDLTPDRIADSFASPDTLSFWTLPEFIDVLENSGFSAVRHRLHFQSLLALPMLAAAMALLAACFSMREARKGGVAQMLGAGVACGFALFLLDRVTGEFGETGTLPVVLAAWAPAAAGMMLALSLLLHLEDG